MPWYVFTSLCDSISTKEVAVEGGWEGGGDVATGILMTLACASFSVGAPPSTASMSGACVETGEERSCACSVRFGRCHVTSEVEAEVAVAVAVAAAAAAAAVVVVVVVDVEVPRSLARFLACKDGFLLSWTSASADRSL